MFIPVSMQAELAGHATPALQAGCSGLCMIASQNNALRFIAIWNIIVSIKR